MKRLCKILTPVLILLLWAALTQCTGGEEHSDTSSTPGSTTTAPAETTAPATPAQTEPTQTEPTQTEPVETEPEFLYFNPLTGEGLPEYSTNRPYAIVFNNVKAAQPQYGVGQADILCEMMTEGGTTRCVGIFHDLADADTFGSIRSARPYMISLAQSFDAIFVHAGRSDEAKELLSSTGWDHIDGVHGSGAGNYFYRDQDRLDAGYAKEHTMFITPESIVAYAEKMGLTFTRADAVEYGWSFSKGCSITGGGADSILIRYALGSSTSSRVKTTALTYNAESGLYAAAQYGADYIDAQTGDALTFRNVLVLRCNTVNQGDTSGHLSIDLVGSGTGYYACGGSMVPILWSRGSTVDPFTFTLEDGTPLTLSVGKTYMGFVSTKSVIDFS